MPKIQEKQIFLSLKEVSEKFNIPLATLRRWASERRFPLYRISNRIRVSEKEWEEWIEKFHIKPRGGQDYE